MSSNDDSAETSTLAGDAAALKGKKEGNKGTGGRSKKAASNATQATGFILPADRAFLGERGMLACKGSGRSRFLRQCYGAVRVSDDELQGFHIYDGVIWERTKETTVKFDASTLMRNSDIEVNPNDISNIVGMLRNESQPLPVANPRLVAFKNGVFDMDANAFREHRIDDWITNENGIIWTKPVQDENIQQHAPLFTSWLDNSAKDDDQKKLALLAALYMCLVNAYDWEMFIEISGIGGSGKSVFQMLCNLMVGAHNVASTRMETLGAEFGLETLIGKRVAIMPEASYHKRGEDPLKAITGGDPVGINRKGVKALPYVILRLIVIMIANTPIAFPEADNGGIGRRRCSFDFPDKVANPDTGFKAKLPAELPVIVRHLFKVFANPLDARDALRQHQKSEEAEAIRLKSNPLRAFMLSLNVIPNRGKIPGAGLPWNVPRAVTGAAMIQPRRYLYHAYLAFCAYQNIPAKLDLSAFRSMVKGHFGALLQTFKGGKNVTCTNLDVRIDAEYLMAPTDLLDN